MDFLFVGFSDVGFFSPLIIFLLKFVLSLLLFSYWIQLKIAFFDLGNWRIFLFFIGWVDVCFMGDSYLLASIYRHLNWKVRI